MAPKSYLPRHKSFELASSRLRYRIFCRNSIPPNRNIGVAGDLYIVTNDNQVFYKERSTIDGRGKWRPATDDRIIRHPFEPFHQLTVTANKFLQWSKNRPKVDTFSHSIPHMNKIISKHHRIAAGDNPHFPIEIDIDWIEKK